MAVFHQAICCPHLKTLLNNSFIGNFCQKDERDVRNMLMQIALCKDCFRKPFVSDENYLCLATAVPASNQVNMQEGK